MSPVPRLSTRCPRSPSRGFVVGGDAATMPAAAWARSSHRRRPLVALRLLRSDPHLQRLVIRRQDHATAVCRHHACAHAVGVAFRVASDRPAPDITPSPSGPMTPRARGGHPASSCTHSQLRCGLPKAALPLRIGAINGLRFAGKPLQRKAALERPKVLVHPSTNRVELHRG